MQKMQDVLRNRIISLCKERGITYYALAYKATVPFTTVIHIIDGTTKNPGILTIIKLCDGLNISLCDFFDTDEFGALIKDVDSK